VPRILAAAVVGRNRDRFGYADLELDAPAQGDFVEVPRSMTLSRLAKLVGTTRDELAQLNPELRRGRTPAGTKAYRLRVPAGSGEAAAASLAKLSRERPAKVAQHKVRLGEDMGSIAKAYGISRAKLARMNEMDRREGVEPGAFLVVPDREKSAPSPETAEPVTVVVPTRHFLYSDRRRVFYQTVSGDTLERISTSFGVTPAEIVLWNDLDGEAALVPGMVLQVFAPLTFDRWSEVEILREEQVRIFVAESTELYEDIAARQERRRIVHRVKAGDTLERISKRYGVSEVSIARINHCNRNHEPEPGEELVLYVSPNKVPRARRGGSKRSAKAVAPPSPAKAPAPAVSGAAEADDAEDSAPDEPATVSDQGASDP